MRQLPDDWDKFTRLRDEGVSPQDIYRCGKNDGLDFFALVRMLRCLFGLNLAEAKEVMLQGEEIADSLEEYQERLIPAIEKTLRQMETDEDA